MGQGRLGGPAHKQWTGGWAWELGQCPLCVPEMEVFPGAGLSLKPHPTIHLREDTGSTAVLLNLCLYNSYRRDWVPVLALTFQ